MIILGIMGSPRKQGNVNSLVDQALAGAAFRGAIVEKLILADKHINYCSGCMVCRNTGECVIRDDMDEVYRLFNEADGFVFGSPMYHRNISSQMKTMLDRIHGVIKQYRRGKKSSRLPLLRQPRLRPAIIVTSLNASFPLAQSYLKSFYQAFYSFTDYAGIDIIGRVATRNTWIKSASDFEPQYQQAYQLGQQLLNWRQPLWLRLRRGIEYFAEDMVNKLMDYGDS